MSNLDLCVWFPVEADFDQWLIDEGYAEMGEDIEGNPVLIEKYHVSRIGLIVETPGTYDENGNELTPSVFIEGFHANVRLYGEAADPKPWHLPKGKKGIGRNKKVKDYVELSYGGALYDPAVLTSPENIWQ